ncbi:RNA polymerase subunit sigma [candidate division LCP-89 bacterium B3_LCP]|uniref:RNA polymerase subunit sigma n=1 Tax=candidate division LCP-89 bacterium B3_LCP TaxID=2012998 RepID=A0A532UYG4_UNCL8|nr:MAG: RNA polymerase subunit sigma [candidate division LCP-89 bacterium B3_LCP]
MAIENDPVSDQELVARAKRGDVKAFSLLVERYQDMVYTLACRTLSDPVRAEDMAQDAFVRAWKAISSFKEKSQFSSWLYRITVNVCYSELRKRGRSEDLLPEEDFDALKIPGWFKKSIESNFEKRDLVNRLINELPPVYQGIVVLFYLEGLDCKEISTILGHPVGTVKAYLHRARARMRIVAESLLNV